MKRGIQWSLGAEVVELAGLQVVLMLQFLPQRLLRFEFDRWSGQILRVVHVVWKFTGYAWTDPPHVDLSRWFLSCSFAPSVDLLEEIAEVPVP